jgi:hypothetical protein
MNLQCASRGLCLDGNGISHLCRWLCLMRESASSFQTLIISIWHAPSPFRTLSHPIALRPLACGRLCMQALRVGVDLVRLWLAVRPSRCSSAPARLGSARAVKYLPMMRGWLRQWQWQSCQEIGPLRSSTSCAVSSRRTATRPVLSFSPRPKMPGSSLLWRAYGAVPQSTPEYPQKCVDTAVFALRQLNGN